MALAACGAPSNAPSSASSPTTGTADVIVTVDAVHHQCVVALNREQQGSSIACGEILPFLKDELRVAPGATYEVRSAPQSDDEASGAVKKSLTTAGYRWIGER